MSLVGFKAVNHPQQTGKRGASDTVDERITPQDLFDSLDREFRFTLDADANAKNAKCPTFFDLASNGLWQSWCGHRVWCNPPYSSIGEWVEKALLATETGCEVVVLLLPANRTEQGWWQRHVEALRDRPRGRVETRFLAKRLNFGVPGNEGGKFKTSAPFGNVLVIVRPPAADEVMP